jgi:hypothetical protein
MKTRIPIHPFKIEIHRILEGKGGILWKTNRIFDLLTVRNVLRHLWFCVKRWMFLRTHRRNNESRD